MKTLLPAMFAFLAAGTAWADNAVEVPLGRAAILHLQSTPAQVVIGNPAIADVTLQSARTLTLFGKFPGGTTLTVLDAKGNALMDMDVVVTSVSASGVSVHYGSGKNWVPGGSTVTVACTVGRCSTPTPVPGDKAASPSVSTAAIK